MNSEGVTAAPMRALFESAPNGVAAFDPDGVMRLVNTPLARMFGHSVRALEGAPLAKLFPERQAAERAAMLRELDPGGAQ